jgi:hypothetical protein
VHGLPESSVPKSEENSAALAAWVKAYVAEASREESVDAFVAHVNAAILADIPELVRDPVLTAELDASTRAQFRAWLSVLERDKQELLLPPQAVDLARSIARRGMDLGVLLKVYRIAAAAVWDFLVQVAADVPEGGPDRTDVLIYLWDHGGTWINEATELLMHAFDDERTSKMQGALARRAETIYALLRGDAIGLDAATTDLGHPLRATQTGLVLWIEDDSATDVLAPLNDLVTSFAAAVKAKALTVPVGRREVWAWLATQGAPDLAALGEVESGAASIAVGIPAAGIAGFRRSHREAVDAQHLAVASGSPGGLIRYADVELACLVADNEAGMEALIERELGPLVGDEKGYDRIRETLLAYLTFGGNVDATASSLIVHKNTIRYRLAQAEELIGHPLTERRTELALALRCLSLR